LKILKDQHDLLKVSNERRLAEIELSNSKLLAIENRTTEEIQSLVHDLKTPLTSIQGLSSVVELKTDDASIKEYSQIISKSADNMSEMISQILHENTKSIIKIDALIDYVFSQLVSSSIKDKISLYNNLKGEKIKVNKIRFSRALINIIENSYNSIDKESGLINLLVSKKDDFIIIKIVDNGKGISEDRLNHIWDIGYSESGSTGLGLNFVKKVIENHDGTIDINSKLEKGTSVTIKIKEVI
jgi:signal transduction histidine kinase